VVAPAGRDERIARPPFGPPSPDTVRLGLDGSVMSMGAVGAPSVSEAAILLQTMLASVPRVPGALQYAIARALLEVDAPPFDSLADFSRALTRFEQGDRRAAVRALLDRHAIARRAASDAAPNGSPQKPGVAPKVTVQLRRDAPGLSALPPRQASDRRRIAAQ